MPSSTGGRASAKDGATFDVIGSGKVSASPGNPPPPSTESMFSTILSPSSRQYLSEAFPSADAPPCPASTPPLVAATATCPVALTVSFAALLFARALLAQPSTILPADAPKILQPEPEVATCVIILRLERWRQQAGAAPAPQRSPDPKDRAHTGRCSARPSA